MRRLACLLLPLVALSCKRQPPPGSGNVEMLSPTGVPLQSAPFTVAAYPGGGSLVATLATCSVARVDKAVRWRRTLTGCDGRLAVAIAPDSTAYARTTGGLYALAPDGVERWRVSVGTDPVPATIFAPAVTLDSLVVVNRARNASIALRPNGTEAWRFQVPESEPLVAPPIGGGGEGVFLTTGTSLYLIASDGSTRFRTALPTATP